jgi:16S rRNA (adenine1518-N6/adenine1519-N6)-dimethyltransferase
VRLPLGGKRELGQHFLADENIVAVAGRMAELGPGDVVLEVGPGLGVLTTHLADRVRLVHAIEIDPSLEPRLRERISARRNVELVFADALRHPLAKLDPPPTKFVSNLPYNVATPLVAESLDGLPSLELWCVMVQREVADRFFSPPGNRDYGAVSVLVQLTAQRTAFHPVSRTVFRPPPNVDSALVAFRRRKVWGPEFKWIKTVVQGSFAHRRKTLVNSLALSGFERERVERVVADLNLPGDIRAERLPAGVFVPISEHLG